MHELISVTATCFNANRTEVQDFGPRGSLRGESLLSSFSRQTQTGRFLICKFLDMPMRPFKQHTVRYAGTDVEVTRQLIAANTDRKKIAFASEYGLPGDPERIKDEPMLGYSIESFEQCRKTLGKIQQIIKSADSAKIQNLFNRRLAEANRKLEYHLEVVDGQLLQKMVLPSLFDFCRYEMLTAFLKNRALSSCEGCGALMSKKRNDARYCSDSCRVKAHYWKKKSA